MRRCHVRFWHKATWRSRSAMSALRVKADLGIFPVSVSLELAEKMMKAFVIATETAKDEAMFAEYRKAVPATIEAFGGKFIVRGGDLKLLEGEWQHPRLVIIEFPSREAAEGWYRSPEYQKIIGLRLNSTVGNLVIVEGQG